MTSRSPSKQPQTPSITQSMTDDAYEILPLNTLSFPKGQSPICELTGYPATVKLVTPFITLNYATYQHAYQSYHGIIHLISPLLPPLLTPPSSIGSTSDRQKRQYTINLSKRKLIEICSRRSEQFIVNHEYELAIPGAIQSLTYLKDIFGSGTIESVPPYLLLAEANLGLCKYGQTEEFLGLANFCVLSCAECSYAIRSQLHRNFGKLYTSQGKHTLALSELSKDIYNSSLSYGPEHVCTSGGYFHMGNVLYVTGRIEGGLAFWDKVVDIWYKFLAGLKNDSEGGNSSGDDGSGFSESQLKDGLSMLQKITQTRTTLLGATHIATGEVKYTTGLLFLYLGFKGEARSLLEEAVGVYEDKLGVEHVSTVDVRKVFESIVPATTMMASSNSANNSKSNTAVSTASTLPRSGSTPGVIKVRTNEGSIEGMEGFADLIDSFPEDMPRAATQSPIPLPPGSRQKSAGGV